MYLITFFKLGVVVLLLSIISTWPGISRAQMPVGVVPTVPLMTGESRDENGEVIPIRPENQKILDYFERTIGIHFDIRRMPIARVIEGVKQGDGIAYGISKTSERLKYMAYSDAIFTDYVWLIVRDDSPIEIGSLAEIKGKSIGIVRGIRFNDEIDGLRNVWFKVEEDPSQMSSRLKKLLSGRMDAMLFNSRMHTAKELENELNMYMVEKNIHGETQDKSRIRVVSKPFLTDDVYFVTGLTTDKSIIGKINAAIIKGRKSGDLPALWKP